MKASKILLLMYLAFALALSLALRAAEPVEAEGYISKTAAGFKVNGIEFRLDDSTSIYSGDDQVSDITALKDNTYVHVDGVNEDGTISAKKVHFIPEKPQNASNTEVKKIDISVLMNPYNEEIKLNFVLPEQSDVNIDVYDFNGKKVENLINESMGYGEHNILFDSNLPNGFYTARIIINGKIYSKAIVKM